MRFLVCKFQSFRATFDFLQYTKFEEFIADFGFRCEEMMITCQYASMPFNCCEFAEGFQHPRFAQCYRIRIPEKFRDALRSYESSTVVGGLGVVVNFRPNLQQQSFFAIQGIAVEMAHVLEEYSADYLLIPPNVSAVVRIEATINKLHMLRNGFWTTGCLKGDSILSRIFLNFLLLIHSKAFKNCS